MTWYCANCHGRTELDLHGRCEKCGSNAIMAQDPEPESTPMQASTAYVKLLQALDSRLPDTELLGIGTADELAKRRMRILNATAQTMIEESSEELNRHKPKMPEKEGIPSYEEITHCTCGLKYAGKMPQAHTRHQDKVLSALILTIRDAVLKTRQVNWMTVKEEADTWQNEELPQ